MLAAGGLTACGEHSSQAGPVAATVFVEGGERILRLEVLDGQPFRQCLVVVNSAEGGYRSGAYINLLPQANIRVDDLTNGRGIVVGYVDDVLVQCFEPPLVAVADVRHGAGANR